MNQSVQKPFVISNLIWKGVLATLTTVNLLTPMMTASVKAEMKDSPKTVVDEVWQIVNNEFVDRDFNQVNWQAKREELLNRNYSGKKDAYKAIKKALKELDDPYTRFLVPEQFQMLTTQTSGEVSGVGVRLAIDKRTQDLIVIETITESPADKAGIKAGDRIVKIEGKPTALMDLEQASEAIRGDLGTSVDLQIARPGENTFDVTITRAQIEVPSVNYALKEEEHLKVGKLVKAVPSAEKLRCPPCRSTISTISPCCIHIRAISTLANNNPPGLPRKSKTKADACFLWRSSIASFICSAA